ncbi:MAG: B12-binding domain-containing radical SAM protein [Vicinamibacterales bacterium]
MRELCVEPGNPVDRDESVLAAEIRDRRVRHIAKTLYEHESDWRLVPGDAGDPTEVSDFAMRRELAIERKLREFAGSDPAELALRRHELKYFPVLWVSAPHIEDAVSGTFPGIPTPILFATSVIDRHLRIDEFPSAMVPEVVAVMNPPLYTPEFIAELSETLRRHRPRLVGISNLSESHYFALEIARIVKEILPECVVIMGGQHENGTNPLAYRSASARVRKRAGIRRATFELGDDEVDRMADVQTLGKRDEWGLVDFVAAGDAPYLLMEFARLLAENLDGGVEALKDTVLGNVERFAELPGSGQLFFVDQSAAELRHVQLSGQPIDGSTLPFISVVDLTHENRFPVFDFKKTAQVMGCNGCKYSCTFCHESAEHFLYGVPKLLERDPEHVAKELLLRREQGYEAVFFDDSTFTQNPRWLNAVLELMEENKVAGQFLEWGCQTTVNDVSAETLTRMADVGCTYIYFGFESARPGAERVQKARQLRVLTDADNWADQFRTVAKWCSDAGIRVGTSLQFGLGESPQERDSTFELIADLYRSGYIAEGCVALNINAPYPGTLQWFDALRDADEPLPDYRNRLVRHPAFETAHQYTSLHCDTVDEIYRKASALLGDAILSVNFEAYENWRQGIAAERGGS